MASIPSDPCVHRDIIALWSSTSLAQGPARQETQLKTVSRRWLSDQRWTAIECILITLAAIVSLEAVRVFWAIAIPYPGVLLLFAVSLAALRAGVWTAAISTTMAVCYEWLYLSDSGPGTFHYTDRNVTRALIFTVVAPAVAALILALQRRVIVAAAGAERQLFQHKLLRERARLQSVIQSLPVGFLMVDSARNVTVHNTRVTTILKHPAGEFVSPSCERMFYENRAGFMPADLPLSRALGGKSVDDEEVLYLRGDQTIAALRMSAAPVRGDDGEVIGAIVALEDVTQQRSARQAAQELAALVNASDDAIFTVSKEGFILSWNPGAEKLFGYIAPEARYMGVEKLIPDDLMHEFQGFMKMARSGNERRQLAATFVRNDGSAFAASISLSPLYGTKGNEVVGVSVVARALEQRHSSDRARDFAA